MTTNSVKIDVDVDIKISDSTAEKCLRILEIWQNDHPDKEIIGTKTQTQNGLKTEFSITSRNICERCALHNAGVCDPLHCRYVPEKEETNEPANEP